MTIVLTLVEVAKNYFLFVGRHENDNVNVTDNERARAQESDGARAA